METILRTTEVAKILGTNIDEVRDLIHKKELKAFRMRQSKKGLGDWRILSSDLKDYVMNRYRKGSKVNK